MKKVVCPACGLVNLERFITYPHCAACGEPLSGVSDPRVPVWKRPVSALWWATLLGLCCAALGVAGILTARETQRTESKRLVVYVQVPHHLSEGQTGKMHISLDAAENGAGIREDFNELQLRLPRAVSQDFTIISISPTPESQIQRRNGIYFYFGNKAQDQRIAVEMRARRSGNFPVSFILYARDFLPLQWRGDVRVHPVRPPRAPGPRISRPIQPKPGAAQSMRWIVPSTRGEQGLGRGVKLGSFSAKEPIMSQKDEDRALAKLARGAMARSVLDITELNVICVGGYIDLQGKVRAPRGGAGTVSVKREFEQIKVLARSVRGVKEVRGDRVILIESH